jgi:hypothetical protein
VGFFLCSEPFPLMLVRSGRCMRLTASTASGRLRSISYASGDVRPPANRNFFSKGRDLTGKRPVPKIQQNIFNAEQPGSRPLLRL